MLRAVLVINIIKKSTIISAKMEAHLQGSENIYGQ